jgi:signal transduction histidine kinase
VDDLLDISRISQGKLELRRGHVELAAVVARAVEMSRPMIEESGHELTIELPQEQLWLEADPAWLDQVLTNLLNNAAKYTKQGGRVWLRARRDGDTVTLAVRDTGLGISGELMPRLLNLFIQSDRTLERAQGGLGIGLSLVKRLIELHGGSVSARSDAPGKGSEFVVRLSSLPHP